MIKHKMRGSLIKGDLALDKDKNMVLVIENAVGNAKLKVVNPKLNAPLSSEVSRNDLIFLRRFESGDLVVVNKLAETSIHAANSATAKILRSKGAVLEVVKYDASICVLKTTKAFGNVDVRFFPFSLDLFKERGKNAKRCQECKGTNVVALYMFYYQCSICGDGSKYKPGDI